MRNLVRALTLVGVVAMVAESNASIVLSEVDLANDQIELVNLGATDVDISGYWLCNRVNGSPFYSQITTATIDAGLSTATSFTDVGAGEILVLNVPGLLPDANGELGLYNTNSFGSSTAIEDYILWGANGIRDIVADSAGIWTDNQSIDVSGMGLTETIQLGLGNGGNSASDYFIGAGSLGNAQSIPEPSALLFLSIALSGVAACRWKKSCTG